MSWQMKHEVECCGGRWQEVGYHGGRRNIVVGGRLWRREVDHHDRQ